MTNPIHGKRIILGVTGSIACYKAADLSSKLAQMGAEVDVVLTPAALEFITPLTFQSVTGRRAYTEEDLWGRDGHVRHISLGKESDLMVVAPITANTMARLAHGIADNLLCVTALAARCPLMIAPAMDGGMFSHPSTQANLEILKSRGVHIVGPAAGHLASGLKAVGRMVEPLELRSHIRRILGADGPLKGKKVLVTAGGTQEALDPVRYIGNHSSGKQGYAVAQAAVDLGAEVVLVSGKTNLTAPVGAELVSVGSAGEMLKAVQARLADADALVMAAAVADYRPETIAAEKIKKTDGGMSLPLVRTPDILKEVHKSRSQYPKLQTVIGFAAETEDLLANAERKLQEKGLDYIVANDVSAADAGFGVDTNRITILGKDGLRRESGLVSKEEAAADVVGLLVPVRKII